MGEDGPTGTSAPRTGAPDLTRCLRARRQATGTLLVMEEPNVVRCPRCGAVRVETPPGIFALPTFGTALKNARGAAGTCECGQRHLDEDERLVDETSA